MSISVKRLNFTSYCRHEMDASLDLHLKAENRWGDPVAQFSSANNNNGI